MLGSVTRWIHSDHDAAVVLGFLALELLVGGGERWHPVVVVAVADPESKPKSQ